MSEFRRRHRMEKRSTRSTNVSRREVLRVASAGLAASALANTASAEAAQIEALTAKPPAGFKPLNVPGKIVKVAAKGDFASYMQPNQLWPKPEVASSMLRRHSPSSP